MTCRPRRGAPTIAERALALDRIAGSIFLLCAVLALFRIALQFAPPGLPVAPQRARAAGSAAATLPLDKPEAAEAAAHLNATEMRLAQERLRDLGFDPGAIDGIAGPRTLGALNQYRSAKGLGPVARIERETVADLLD